MQNERSKFNKDFEFIVSTLGFAAGFGSVWRFPYVSFVLKVSLQKWWRSISHPLFHITFLYGNSYFFPRNRTRSSLLDGNALII